LHFPTPAILIHAYRYLWSFFGGKKEEVDPTAGMSREVLPLPSPFFVDRAIVVHYIHMLYETARSSFSFSSPLPPSTPSLSHRQERRKFERNEHKNMKKSK
jgi:hypothetical protein